MNKKQFMLKKVSYEWNQSKPTYFVRSGILEYFGLSKKFWKQRFSQLSEKIQNKVAKFVENELEYCDDWKAYCVKHNLEMVVQK